MQLFLRLKRVKWCLSKFTVGLHHNDLLFAPAKWQKSGTTENCLSGLLLSVFSTFLCRTSTFARRDWRFIYCACFLKLGRSRCELYIANWGQKKGRGKGALQICRKVKDACMKFTCSAPQNLKRNSHNVTMLFASVYCLRINYFQAFHHSQPCVIVEAANHILNSLIHSQWQSSQKCVQVLRMILDFPDISPYHENQ